MKALLTILAAALFAASAHAQLLPMSDTQRDLASLDRKIQGTAYYVSLAVQAAASQHSEVWSKDDASLASLLSAIGPEATAQLVEQHRQGATALNAIAAMLGISARAPVEPSREFSFVNGVAVVVPIETEEGNE